MTFYDKIFIFILMIAYGALRQCSIVEKHEHKGLIGPPPSDGFFILPPIDESIYDDPIHN